MANNGERHKGIPRPIYTPSTEYCILARLSSHERATSSELTDELNDLFKGRRPFHEFGVRRILRGSVGKELVIDKVEGRNRFYSITSAGERFLSDYEEETNRWFGELRNRK